MSELPDRPDLDQLRRQARELLRAAADGEPRAVTRLRAVSERVTLSAAQLAIAREHGCPSWPALGAEVRRRRRLSESAGRRLQGGDVRGPLDTPDDRWSFGGGTAIKTSAGVLFPEALVVGAGHAVLDASLLPAGNGEPAAARPRRLLAPGMPFARLVPGRARATRGARRRRADAAVATMTSLARPDDVTIIDDQGARYALHPERMWGKRGPSGGPAGPMSVRLRLDPVPGREVRSLELRSQNGAATRLARSARPAVRIGQLAPVVASPAERELSDQAFGLMELHLTSTEVAADILRQRCSAALARIAETQRSGELGPAGELPDQLRQLCVVLTEHRPADGLPRSWSGMLDAAQRADGPRYHLDICAALPPIDGVAVQADILISMPDGWRLYLRATPGWWNYSEDGHRKWNRVWVHAEDDRAGTYLSIFDGSTGHRGNEELALRFLPRLDPLARALKLTYRGAREEIVVDIGLVPAAAP
jgi:antitoxin (DNA-binding transcriptional repressor) of toxin-antitoxin stability system